MPSPWVWDDASNRYRSSETGRYIGIRQMLPMRDTFIEAQKSAIDDLAGRLVAGDIDTAQWEGEFKAILRTTYKDEYALGCGGRNAMTQSDYGRIGAQLRRQYDYLYRFADQIETGQLTEAQIRMRSRMYVDSSTQMFERAWSATNGLPTLSQYPADGQTQCRSNCKCHLQYEDKGDHWEVYWKLGMAEHCPDCVELSESWAPLVVEKANA